MLYTQLTLNPKTALVTNREVTLVFTLFSAVIFTVFASQINNSAIITFLSRHATDIANKQLADLSEAHRKRIASLKAEHNAQLHRTQSELTRIHGSFDRLNTEYDWMSGMYQDCMRTAQEQEDRIAYLEVKLLEFGQLTPAVRAPFSAPPGQVRFSNPPRRARFDSAVKSASPVASPLAQVMETGEEM